MTITEHIAAVRREMAEAARESGRSERDIILVGASKMNDAAACQEAIAAGIDALGENRVQEMTAKLAENAYAGRPLHFIGHLQRNKVRQVVGNVIRQMENERALHTIQSVFQSRESQPAAPAGRQEVWRRRIQYILSQLGMAGEKGAGDIMELCLFLLERKQTASQIGVGTLCSQLSDSPKTMEQRVRRAVERGLGHIASLGVEDYGNEFFTQYAAVLFPFPEVRAEMAHLRGKGGRGKVNLKKFLDGMLILTEEY